ncbi:lipid-A kinase [Kushneria sinocarnis]|uniref:Lipid-A kinase n=1 Tax=Kushneria sinocarnis TaxID=595502 RepID=A0A420WTK5_9GAMM|nr:phosphatase PAP2 family protein [Kushneria sinocarnis]RKQ96854.1 lipid-A kinase [Kushneria sinocarnis]
MHLRRILIFNLLGAALLFSWGWPHLLLWTDLDERIFWFFNNLITPQGGTWDTLLAALNNRLFDIASFAVMGLLFRRAMRHDPRPLRHRNRRWLGIGLTMLLTAGVMAMLTDKGIRYGHPSPTRFFEHARHLADVVTFPTKDGASNSFPGDHGLMLMIFAAFMLRFADRYTAWLSMAFVVLLSAPRIMVGAHWFSDVYMGSLSIALLILPWLLCTPLASQLATRIGRLLPMRSA